MMCYFFVQGMFINLICAFRESFKTLYLSDYVNLLQEHTTAATIKAKKRRKKQPIGYKSKGSSKKKYKVGVFHSAM